MQVENHKEEVPFSYYQELFAAMDPQSTAQRLKDAGWDGQAFHVTLLGRTFAISHPTYEICPLDGGPVPPLPTQTFLLRYLLECRDEPWEGQWKTFREMPWGEMYIKPYTGRVLTRAAFTFWTRLEAFRKGAQKLGGEPVPHGDVGFRFCLIGGYYMQIQAWAGDEEFPPNAQVLYSDNFARGFAAEDRVVAGDILISTIKANM